MSDIHEELGAMRSAIEVHHAAIFGDAKDPRNNPGIIADQMRMTMEQKRTNEILTELVSSVRWITRLIIGGLTTGAIAGIATVFWKGISGH